MFDIGFWEIAVISVVALIVVGPERFPGLVRSVGMWLGRFRRIITTVKSEIREEVDKAEQLKALMDEQLDIVKRHETLDDSKPNVPLQGKSAESPSLAKVVPPASAKKTTQASANVDKSEAGSPPNS